MVSLARSCNDLLHYIPGHIGQTERAAVVLERQSLVIEPHEVEHCCVKVVDVDLAFNAVVAEVVSDSVCDTTFHSAAGHLHCEAVMIVFAAVAVLCMRSATEFAAHHDHRRIQQAIVVQIVE